MNDQSLSNFFHYLITRKELGWINSLINIISDLFLWDWELLIWWSSLSFFSIINIILWIKIKNQLDRENGNWSKNEIQFSTIQAYLSLGYVIVCAFRSFLPRADVQKIVLWDTWFSSVLVGRSVATIGELCLALQLALFLKFISKKYNSYIIDGFSKIIFPILCLAECFSWYSVITTNYIGNTIEESLWCISGGLILISSLILIKKSNYKEKTIYIILSLMATSYVLFMVLVDIPMYYNRLIIDLSNSKQYYTLTDGLKNLNSSWVVTHNYSDWNGELSWMFLYFTTAVWMSLGLIRIPFIIDRFHQNEKIKYSFIKNLESK